MAKLQDWRSHYNLINSMMAIDMVSIPITLEQLITAVQQLQPEERAEVARALILVDLRSDLRALIQELYAQPSVDEITDDNIMAEIKAVRQQSHQT
ncbi:hypothetical protein [Nostoc sp. FACHB-888]|uniref:hypothetical protein n=1 Tax=Nostoc sp. FACHB-888 TaxID=2692842 RepID=UPI001F55948D|nr:hypothetical protein [Nostoc sp. FACHB-888]